MYAGDVAASEMIEVLEPSKYFPVPEADEDDRKVLKFAKNNIPYYNPKAGYAYYEFTGSKYITSDKNVMALKKKVIIIVGSICNNNTIMLCMHARSSNVQNGKLYTGPGVFKLAGVGQCHDEAKEVKAPDLSGTEWECIFIQGRKGYGRLLEPNTQFLYCEYDYNPEFY